MHIYIYMCIYIYIYIHIYISSPLETPSPQHPTVGLSLGPYGGPRGGRTLR